MEIFVSIQKIDNAVFCQEEFDVSFFGGADKLLNAKDYKSCMFLLTDDNEINSELYYFLEGASDVELIQDNMSLNKLDEIKFVLIDDFEKQGIVILKRDQETVENFI